MLIQLVLVALLVAILGFWYFKYYQRQRALDEVAKMENYVNDVLKLTVTASSSRKNALATNNLQVAAAAASDAAVASNNAGKILQDCLDKYNLVSMYDDTKKRADVAITAIKAGADFSAIAASEAMQYVKASLKT